MFLQRIFAGGERSFAFDFMKAAFAIIFLATVGTNIVAFGLNTGSSETQTIQVTEVKATPGTRSYTQVRSVLDGDAFADATATLRPQNGQRSVLDDEIVTGTANLKLNRVQIDPCKAAQPE